MALLAVAIFGAAVVSGCAGLENTSNTAPKPLAAVQISPSAMTFPNAPVGQQVTQSATLTNTSNGAVSITQLEASAPEFTTSGLTLPVNLGPGQSTMFKVAYRGTSVGAVSATLTAMTAHGEGSGKTKLNGASGKTSSQLSLSATSLKYGNVLLNGSSTQAVTLKNSGQSNVDISQINVTGAGFSVSGVAVPATIPAGQSVALQATFAPTTAGASTGSVTITSDATTPTASVALSGTGMSASYTMSLAPSAVNLGNVNVGATASQSIQLANTGNGSVTISQVSATGSGVSVSGFSSPIVLNPSQSMPLTVTYKPAAPGATAGSITVTNSDGVNTVAAVTANAVQAALSVSPASASFGSVTTGSSSAAQQIQLKNSGTANLTINSATISGSGFSASGLTFPLTLIPGQSAALNVQYAPTAAGASTGAISFSSTASPAAVALSGTGVTSSYTMALSPASIAFGNINTGSTAAQTVTLTNTGNSSISISQVSASGTGVSVSGLSTGASIAPSQSVPLSITFSPTAKGSVTGGLSITCSQGASASASITGTGVQAGLSVTPGSAAFGNVVTGNTNSQTIQLTNTGNATLTVSQATVAGSGFSIGSLSVPLNIAPNQSASFNVQYAPTAAGAVSGSLSILSNASSSPAIVALSGAGVAATSALAVNPASLSFGSVTDGTTASQSFTFTNTGNSNVAVSGVSIKGTGYSILSGSGAVTLSPNQSVSVSVQFAPGTAGSASGTVSIASNASASPSVSLSGTGVAQVSHSVTLNWGASTSSVTGYNVYRTTVSGSSYSRVNGSLVAGLSFSDSNVTAGQTYYYVATSVDSSGTESAYSNEVSSTVP